MARVRTSICVTVAVTARACAAETVATGAGITLEGCPCSGGIPSTLAQFFLEFPHLLLGFLFFEMNYVQLFCQSCCLSAVIGVPAAAAGSRSGGTVTTGAATVTASTCNEVMVVSATVLVLPLKFFQKSFLHFLSFSLLATLFRSPQLPFLLPTCFFQLCNFLLLLS